MRLCLKSKLSNLEHGQRFSFYNEKEVFVFQIKKPKICPCDKTFYVYKKEATGENILSHKDRRVIVLPTN
jgi:hypothetical protein